MIKKLILLIIIFFIIHSLSWFILNNKNKIIFVKSCNLQEYCKLPNNDIIYVNKAIKLNFPFDLYIKRKEKTADIIYIYFSMKNMDMGFNKYSLNYDVKNNVWVVKNVILPICSNYRNDYILNLVINNDETYKISFKVN